MTDKLSEHIKAVATDTDELVAAFFEAIERLQVGNPRFTKKERQMWSKFFTNAISDVSVLLWMLQGQNNLRLDGKEILASVKKRIRLSDKAKDQLIEIMRVTRELILDNRDKDAVDLLTKIIDYYDNEPPLEDC